MWVVEMAQPRQVIRPVESTQKLENFPHHLLQLLGLTAILRQIVPLPKHAPHDVVEGRSLEVLPQPHEPTGRLLDR